MPSSVTWLSSVLAGVAGVAVLFFALRVVTAAWSQATAIWRAEMVVAAASFGAIALVVAAVLVEGDSGIVRAAIITLAVVMVPSAAAVGAALVALRFGRVQRLRGRMARMARDHTDVSERLERRRLLGWIIKTGLPRQPSNHQEEPGRKNR